VSAPTPSPLVPPPPDEAEPSGTPASAPQPARAERAGTEVLVLGVDCAARASGVGLVRAVWSQGSTRILEADHGRGGKPMVAFAGPRLADWLVDWNGPVALALDAPLGWPAPLAEALQGHASGEPFAMEPEDPNRLWRRATDVAVRRLTGKTPLEVGADRIARAAKAALDLLRDLRERSGRAFPVTLTQGPPRRDCALEVYPAAVRAAHPALPRGGRKTDPDVRLALAEALASVVSIDAVRVEALAASDHVLDAGLCVLAASEVLGGKSVPPSPSEEPLARREGWIWVRSPFEGELSAPAPPETP